MLIADFILEDRKKVVEKLSNVSPHKLFEMAYGNTNKYKELMLVHGYLIPKRVGEHVCTKCQGIQNDGISEKDT